MATLNLADVWRETRAVVARHFADFATLAAAAVLLPSLATRLLMPGLRGPGLDPGKPPQLPADFFVVVAVIVLLQFAGLFAIASVSADRAEGGGRPLGTTLRAALPGFGRFLVAVLVIATVYLLASVVLGIVVGLVAAIFLVASGGAPKGDAATMALSQQIVLLTLAVVVPVLVWAFARLSPMVGVFLREPVGAVAGIRRALALSRGSAGPVAALVAMLLGVSLAIVAVEVRLSAALPGTLGGLAVALLTATTAALVFVYHAAALGVIYRRLTG